MNLNFHTKIPYHFSDESRTWIYQSERPFLLNETIEIKAILEDFISNWKSHGNNVKGYGGVFFNHFIILMADEKQTAASGCSIDSSVRIIKEIEKKYNINLLNRQKLAFIINDDIQLLQLQELENKLKNNLINLDTLFFDNLILTKKELIKKWITPVKESWLVKRINIFF